MGGLGYKIFLKQTIANRDASLQPTYTQVMRNVVTAAQTYTMCQLSFSDLKIGNIINHKE